MPKAGRLSRSACGWVSGTDPRGFGGRGEPPKSLIIAAREDMWLDFRDKRWGDCFPRGYRIEEGRARSARTLPSVPEYTQKR